MDIKTDRGGNPYRSPCGACVVREASSNPMLLAGTPGFVRPGVRFRPGSPDAWLPGHQRRMGKEAHDEKDTDTTPDLHHPAQPLFCGERGGLPLLQRLCQAFPPRVVATLAA